MVCPLARSQSRMLTLSLASHPPEASVLPSLLKARQRLARGDIPGFDGVVVAACRGEELAVGAEGQDADGAAVALQRAELLAGLGLPDLDALAEPARGDVAAIRAIGQGRERSSR